MFIRKIKKPNGRVYLSIVHSYRTSDGKSRSKTIKSLGYLDELEKEFDDPIAHFKAECERMNEEAKQKNASVMMEFFPNKKIDVRSCNQIELGAAIPSAYFHRDLGIWDFFEKKRTARKFKYDPCRILEMLVWDRISHPSSKLSAWENREKFPRKCNFSKEDVYRCLSYLQKNADALVKHMNATLEEKRGQRNKTRLYYDVTNYYFEIENEDDLRRRGVSKEHRPNPIVQMGLLLDGEGIPLDYEIFAGNTGDMLTMMPVMKKANLKNKHDGEHVVVVADKGLNTSNNIAACILDGNGYILSQSVRKAPKSLKNWVLDESDYEVNQRGTFKIKSRQANKTITVENDEGKKIRVDVPVKEVAFWSKDFFDRSRYERAKVIEKSTAAINRADYSSNKAHSKIRYAKNVAYDETTGEVAKDHWFLDEEKIAEDEAMDGYYCIVTSEVNMDDRDIIEAYRGLWKIEDSFRVMKTDFDARPVYCSTEEHIRAHFLICYISLLIMRLMQIDTDWQFSASEISDELSKIVGHKMKQNFYLFDHFSGLIEKLCAKVGIEINREILSKGQIREIMAKVKK